MRIAVLVGLFLALAAVVLFGLRHQAREAEALAQAEIRLRAVADRVRALEDLRPLCTAYRA